MPADSDYTAEATAAWNRLLPFAGHSPTEVTMRIRRSANLLAEGAERVVRQNGVANFGDYELLSVLRRAEAPQTPAVLADRLLVTRAGVTGRLARLEKQALVTRVPNPEDARSSLVGLTPAGVETTDAAYLDTINHNQQVLAVLSTSEQIELASFLEKMLVSLDDHPRNQQTSAPRTGSI